MFKFFLVLFLFSISCGKKQDPAEKTLRAFINDVVSKELNNDELINKHLCKISPKDKAKADEIISFQIDLLRKELLSIRVRDISYKKYIELTPAEQNRYLDTDSTKKNIMVAYHKNKKISDFLVVNNKVTSLGTMNKGGTLVFVKLCRDY